MSKEADDGLAVTTVHSGYSCQPSYYWGLLCSWTAYNRPQFPVHCLTFPISKSVFVFFSIPLTVGAPLQILQPASSTPRGSRLSVVRDSHSRPVHSLMLSSHRFLCLPKIRRSTPVTKPHCQPPPSSPPPSAYSSQING